EEKSNVQILHISGSDRPVKYYTLDVIISVGYRVKSLRSTQFRIWATQRLREYLIKGFTLNNEMLKEAGGGDYFDELLSRIRDIRSSEKVFWRKVLNYLKAYKLQVGLLINFGSKSLTFKRLAL